MGEAINSQKRPPYPCPVCADTMLPGVTYTFPRPPEARSCGRLWYPYNGPSLVDGSGQLLDCHKCKDTGEVDERRERSRRLRGDRRAAMPRKRLRGIDWPEQGTNSYSIDAIGREGGKASTETKK